MTLRRSIPVTLIASVPNQCTRMKIIYVGDGFHAHANGVVVAACKSAKRLVDWCWEEGMDEVRCDFDWKLADGEP